MKKRIFSYLAYITLVLPCVGVGGGLLSSCDDMFEPAKENNRQEEAMYEEANYAHGLLMYAYGRLPYLKTSQTDVATDDAVTNDINSKFKNMTTGTWAADKDPMTQWNTCKDGVQYANLFLSKVDKVKWALSAASKNQMFINRMKGEAFGLRAIFYYYLLQAHGGYAEDGMLYGVPLLIAPENAGSEFNQPRASFAACVKQIFADCDSAMLLLPYEYKDVSSFDEIPEKYKSLNPEISGFNLVLGNKAKNLVSAKVAEAVKAQAALLAASPAFRDQSGVTSAEAATLCANVLKRIGGVAGLDPVGNVWYSVQSALLANADMPELLWREDRSTDNDQESANFPPSFLGMGRINPSQNLVDAFPMLNGYPKDDSRSGYDAKNPYANRDPRLDKYILHHESIFKDFKISTGYDIPDEDGYLIDNIKATELSTYTGYYMKKLLYENITVSGASLSQYYHFYPRIRYTELFLAYAEAANDAWGPASDPTGVGFTAYDVIKAIRDRAGIGKDASGAPLPEGDMYLEECKADKDKMTQLIRNERRIELCFENKRFWDMRRWKMPLDEPVYGMEITRNGETGELSYKVIQVEERKFNNSYMHYGPIPNDEILKWDRLVQNVGWEMKKN